MWSYQVALISSARANCGQLNGHAPPKLAISQTILGIRGVVVLRHAVAFVQPVLVVQGVGSESPVLLG